MNSETLTQTRIPTWVVIGLLGLTILFCAVRNLPWHLDNYDQAKQAFVSFEIVNAGEWWFQHTPSGNIATKPPLAGWISAALRFVLGENSWEIAWRLPSFASAMLLLWMVWREGIRLSGPTAACLSAVALLLNQIGLRLSTLVRTDMLLTLFIFLAGWLVLEKVRTRSSWTTRDRCILALLVLASMLTKGPILYAFLLPGLLAFAWLMHRKGLKNDAWSGWWPWFLPLLIFGLWAVIGISLSREFYEQVVLKEFLGRFEVGVNAVHKNQPVYFYFVHYLSKWMPWSIALIALCCVRRIRQSIARDPALLWLICWAVGGFVLISLVPSKRPDRMFPVIPPLCLVLGVLVQRWLAEAPRQRFRWVYGAVALAVVVNGGYAISKIVANSRTDQRALVHFGMRVRAATGNDSTKLAVAKIKDEGLLLYLQKTEQANLREAINAWKSGDLEWLVLNKAVFEKYRHELEPANIINEVGDIPEKQGPYLLLHRVPTPRE